VVVFAVALVFLVCHSRQGICFSSSSANGESLGGTPKSNPAINCETVKGFSHRC